MGALFTNSSKMDDVIALHEVQSEVFLSKFAIFYAGNSQMPYIGEEKYLIMIN